MIAHIGGFPVEEALAAGGPALLVALGVATAKLRARYLQVRSRAASRARHEILGR